MKFVFAALLTKQYYPCFFTQAEMKEIISNVMVIGDKRKHLAAIVTLRTQMDAKNQPTDLLHPDVKEASLIYRWTD